MISAEWKSSTTPGMTPQSHRELVERVLASAAFAKSKRLSSLLAYLCELTLDGRAAELNEQHVGEAVFGRPRDYDSMIDGIVRTQASRLRQRLDLYFAEEGAKEPVRITIPRGSYAPLFETKPKLAEAPKMAAPAEIPVVELPAALMAPVKTRQWLPWSVSALSILILATVLMAQWLHGKKAHAASMIPAHPLWSTILPRGGNTLLVPGDSSLVIWQWLKNRSIDLDEYIRGDYRDYNPNVPLSPEKEMGKLASGRYTSIVDLEVAEALGRIARDQSSTVTVRYPRELRPNDLKQDNLILVGSAEANPWITLFEREMNFTLYNDRAHHIYWVYNRTPQGNEPHSWNVITSDRQHRVYAVVAWLPNFSGEGHALLLEGTTMAGTECAWDFVSDDSRLMPFLQKIRRPDGSLPAFEVLLGTNNISGSAVDSTILSYRLH